jgi:hypothetical protein
MESEADPEASRNPPEQDADGKRIPPESDWPQQGSEMH